MLTQQEYWTQSLSYGMSKEDYALHWIRDKYKHVLKDVQRIPYDDKDNSANRLLGDITMLTLDNMEYRFEVKSRTNETTDLCFEVFYDKDGNVHLKTKYVHYYLFLLPKKVPFLVQYLEFQQLFYNELLQIGEVHRNRYGKEPIFFINIEDFLTAYKCFMGYSGYFN